MPGFAGPKAAELAVDFDCDLFDLGRGFRGRQQPGAFLERAHGLFVADSCGSLGREVRSQDATDPGPLRGRELWEDASGLRGTWVQGQGAPGYSPQPSAGPNEAQQLSGWHTPGVQGQCPWLFTAALCGAKRSACQAREQLDVSRVGHLCPDPEGGEVNGQAAQAPGRLA